MTGEELRSKAHWRHVQQAFERKASERQWRHQGSAERAYIDEYRRARTFDEIPTGEPE